MISQRLAFSCLFDFHNSWHHLSLYDYT